MFDWPARMKTLTFLASSADEPVANDAVITIARAIALAHLLMVDAPRRKMSRSHRVHFAAVLATPSPPISINTRKPTL